MFFRRFRGLLATLVCLGAMLLAGGVQAATLPAPTDMVTDLTQGQTLTPRAEQTLEATLAQYQAQTSNQIGVLLVTDHQQYASTWADFIQTVQAKYNTNALLLVVDTTHRRNHLLVDARLESKTLWSDADTDEVLDLLAAEFRQGDFNDGLTDFADYAIAELPRDIAVAQEEIRQQELLAEEVRRFTQQQLILFWLAVLALCLGAYAAWATVQRWRVRHWLGAITGFYNTQVPLFTADSQVIGEPITDPLVRQHYDQLLQDLHTLPSEIEVFLQQSQQTPAEVRALYDRCEHLENHWNDLVNTYAEIEADTAGHRAQVTQLENALRSKLDQTNL